MTTGEDGLPHGGGRLLRIPESVPRLHRRWTRIRDRLTGAGPACGLPPSESERLDLILTGEMLERQIARTRAHTLGDVVLKLQMAACPALVSGDWRQFVESAAHDLTHPDPATPLARPGRRRRA